ncbi:MAG: aminotransferase class I/II-fold pyridoxal phosphate-dependent enzyme [bacterium]
MSRLSQERLSYSRDLSATQSVVDCMVGHFAEEAANWRSLAAMATGSLFYRVGRIGTLALASRAGQAAPLFQLASYGIGLGAEVTAFEGSSRFLATLSGDVANANLWRWDGRGGWREGLSSSLVTFGMLKAAGHAAEGQNILLQHLFSDFAMVGGHQAASALGFMPRPEGSFAEQMLQAEVTNLQLGAGMALLHCVSPGLAAFERGLDLSIRMHEAGPRSPETAHRSVFDSAFPLAVEGAIGDAVPTVLKSVRLEPGKEENISLMVAHGEGGNGTRLSADIPRVFREVLEKGQRREVEALKNVLLGVVRAQAGNGALRIYADRLESKDPEQWKVGIRSFMRDSRFHSFLEGHEAFEDFAEDWARRPHFTSVLEIPLEIAAGTKRVYTLQRELAALQQAMVKEPSVDGFVKFLLENQVTPMASQGGAPLYESRKSGPSAILFRRVVAQDGGTLFIGNWRHAGVRLNFDASGFFHPPIYACAPYAIETVKSYVPGAPAGKRGLEAGPADGNRLARRGGENPSEWAQRLLEISQEAPPETLQEIAAYLHEMLLNPAARGQAREVVDRLKSLTSGTPEGRGLLVRDYEVEGLDAPITLLSLPTTFLPEEWSMTFVQGIAREFARRPESVARAIEVGSGTGFVSLVLSRLGGARQIIAVDKNPHAQVVGALNATLNGVTNVDFRTGDRLLLVGETADLILGCLPQMPSKRARNLDLRELADYAEEAGAFEDPLGLGLVGSVIDQARDRLVDGGRLWLMMADRPGEATVRELFARRGFHSRFLHTRLIPQDPSTDFSALAAIEGLTGFQFSFHNREGGTISAREAMRRPKPDLFHRLHLTEGRMYRSLFHDGMVQALSEERRWGYTESPGTEESALHSRLTEVLSAEWEMALSPETVFVGPSSAVLLEGLLRLTVPERGRVGVVGNLSPEEARAVSFFGAPVSMPVSFTRIAERIDDSHHDAVVLRLPRQILADGVGLGRLAASAAANKTRLIFIEPFPSQNDSKGRVLARVLAETPEAAPYVIVLQPLNERFGVPEYPLSVAMIADSNLRSGLAQYADVAYSRASSVLQGAYQSFLSRFGDEGGSREEKPLSSFDSVVANEEGFAPFARAFWVPEVFEEGPETTHGDPIDMSFGESEWRRSFPITYRSGRRLSPEALHALELHSRAAAADYVTRSRGARFSPEEMVLGAGVQPLILSALRAIRQVTGGRPLEVVVPEPSYGIFFPTVLAAGARLLRLPTTSADGYRVEPQTFTRAPSAGKVERALLLNTPNNPAGQYYSIQQLKDLRQAATRQGTWLLMDEIFFLLNLAGTPAKSIASISSGEEEERLITFGGLSKEFALGGIRWGYAATRHSPLREAMRENLLATPDPVALQVSREVLPHSSEWVAEHLQYLAPRASALRSFFSDRGFAVPRVEGGYSVFVNLNPLFSSPHFFEGERVTSANFPSLLMREAGIRIKSESWAGIPGQFRFVFAIDRLEEAIRRLGDFFDQIR